MTGESAAPDVVRMRLKPGSLAVIASDGVISGDDDAWLRELMRGDEADGGVPRVGSYRRWPVLRRIPQPPQRVSRRIITDSTPR